MAAAPCTLSQRGEQGNRCLLKKDAMQRSFFQHFLALNELGSKIRYPRRATGCSCQTVLREEEGLDAAGWVPRCGACCRWMAGC